MTNDTRKPVKPEIGKYYRMRNGEITTKIEHFRYYNYHYKDDKYSWDRNGCYWTHEISKPYDLMEECNADGSPIMKEEVKMIAFIEPITDIEASHVYRKFDKSDKWTMQEDMKVAVQQFIDTRNAKLALGSTDPQNDGCLSMGLEEIIKRRNKQISDLLDLHCQYVSDKKQAEKIYAELLVKHQKLIDENKSKDKTINGLVDQLSPFLHAKEPIIDISKIKVGDTVILRNGETGVVIDLNGTCIYSKDKSWWLHNGQQDSSGNFKSPTDIISFTPASVDRHADHKKLYEAYAKNNPEEYKNWQCKITVDDDKWEVMNGTPVWNNWCEYRRKPPFPVSLTQRYKTKHSKDVAVHEIIIDFAYGRSGNVPCRWDKYTGENCLNKAKFDLIPVEPQYD